MRFVITRLLFPRENRFENAHKKPPFLTCYDLLDINIRRSKKRKSRQRILLRPSFLKSVCKTAVGRSSSSRLSCKTIRCSLMHGTDTTRKKCILARLDF
jgi:hypothetical protein